MLDNINTQFKTYCNPTYKYQKAYSFTGTFVRSALLNCI